MALDLLEICVPVEVPAEVPVGLPGGGVTGVRIVPVDVVFVPVMVATNPDIMWMWSLRCAH